MSVSPARSASFDILLRVERESSYASELLRSSRYTPMSLADHALATELVMGVLRWRSLLDDRISDVASQPLSKVDVEVLTALRMGAYQLGWLDRIPAHAAIHESVELVKRARKRSAAPFANAILRKLADSRAKEKISSDQIATSTTLEDLAMLSAHPAWIVERWVKQFGTDTARMICDYDQQIPTTTIRLRDRAAEEDLRKEGIQVAPANFLSSARTVVSGDVIKSPAFAASRVVIQDEASQLVAALVGRGKRILDGCAAPGGKTLSIADRNPDAAIVAVELHPHRADLLRKRVVASNLQVVTGDLLELVVMEPFDRVLLDVPCSGTGTIARNPEIKWRLSRQDLRDLAGRQLALLQTATKHVGRSGRLIYSTCSLEREEDETVVEQALAENPEFRLLDCSAELERLRLEGEWIAPDTDSFLRGSYLRTIPGVQRCDGFFAAILERK